jgi:CheY-like chemotaxis protein
MSPDCLADLKIVLVEDHDDARRYLELFLSDLGAKVVVARNGHEGLKAVKDSSPDLVLSDIKMPGMDGLELLDEIRALGVGCCKQCTCHCDERIFLADRWRPHKSSKFSGMLAEAIHSR